MQIVSGSIARKLKRKLHRIRARVSRDSSSSSSLGSDWLRRTSRSSWEFSDYTLDSDDDDDDGSCLPKDVPEGYLAVYVGKERKRFVVDAQHLNHPWFKVLLERSAEEFGFDHKNGLTLPCEVVLFEHMLWMLEHDHPTMKQQLEMEELLRFHCGFCFLPSSSLSSLIGINSS